MTTSTDHGHPTPSGRAAPRGDMAFRPIAIGPRLNRVLWPSLVVLGSIAFTVFSIRGLWGSGMLAFGDMPRFPDDASAFVDGYREAWSDRGLGGPYPSITWALFLASALAFVGGDGPLAQQLVVTLWIPVAFCGMAYLCRRYLETSWLLAAMGGLLYVVTPVSIGLVVGGAVGLIWSYALLPLVLVGAEALRRRSSSIAWFALPVALLAATSPELLAFGLVIALVWIAIGRGRETFLVVGVVALGAAAIATVPSLAGRGGIGLSDSLIDKMTIDFEYTYSEITPLNLLRLAGNHGDPMDPLGYNGASTWVYAGYVLVAALMAGFVLRRRGDLFVLRLVALAAVAFGALLGIALLTRANPDVFGSWTPAFVFRNPGKLMILLAAAVVPAAVYGVRRLFEVFPQRRESLRILVAGGLALYLIAYAGPALTGDWGVKEVRGSTYAADPGLQASAQFIKRQEPNGFGRWRTIWLPFAHEDALNLEWTAPYWANEPVPENRDPQVEQAIALLDDALGDLDVRRFHAIADRSAVKYVVLREDADPELTGMFLGDPRMSPIRRGQGFVVWRNAAALPRIRQYSGLKAVAVTEAPPPVRYRSNPIVTLSHAALDRTSGWTTYGTRRFSKDGDAIRARASSTAGWPILARRIPAVGDATYLVSAQIRTRRVADAHLKMTWFRRGGDREHLALDRDYAEPILSGNNPWTRVSAVVESPPGARFGEVAFLAGRRPEGSSRPALSWVRNIRVSNMFIGDRPATPADAVADALPDIAPRGYEIVEAERIPQDLTGPGGTRFSVDGVVVNPGPRTKAPASLGQLRGSGGQVEIVSRAQVMLRPRVGDWQRRGDSAVVVSERGRATLPLGVVPTGRYDLALSGCRLGADAVDVVRRIVVLQPTLRGPRQGCGRFETSRPVLLKGRVTLRMTLPRGASIATVQATPAPSRPARSPAGALTISRADTPSPDVRGLSSRGVTLADAYHSGWGTSGSGATQVRTFPGFNSFVVDEPRSLTGLSYGPQQGRDLLVVVGALGWIAIVALFFFGSRVSRRLIPEPGLAPRRSDRDPDAPTRLSRLERPDA
jgi:hypothetical protein